MLVSTNGDDVDLGHFKSPAWAQGAVTLANGLVYPNYEVIAANINTNNKGLSEAYFMLEFECPAAPKAAKAQGYGAVSEKQSKPQQPIVNKSAQRSKFTAAMLYEVPVALSTSSMPLRFLLESVSKETQLDFTNHAGFWMNPRAAGGYTKINDPFCWLLSFLGGAFENAMLFFQEKMLYMDVDAGAYICAYNYPSALQPVIDESNTLSTDKDGNTLPAVFQDLVVGNLSDMIPPSVVAAESATYYWCVLCQTYISRMGRVRMLIQSCTLHSE